MSTIVQRAAGSRSPTLAASSNGPPRAITVRGSRSTVLPTRGCGPTPSHHAGRDAADDLVSETMTRAVAGITRFRWTPAGIEPWLFGIARRVTVDHHRRAGRRRRWNRRVLAAPAPASPADSAEIADEHVAIRAAFARLSEADREVLELRVIAGLTPEQTAAVLGKRPGAVRTAQSRALARLRKEMWQR